jgi:predicted DNA-binding transcriptional regulator YafY
MSNPSGKKPEKTVLPASLPSRQDSGQGSRRTIPFGFTGLRPVNGTAYRIFKLLLWLIDAPISVNELNHRFLKEPGIGKALSDDSIWLYINTLKTLGCQIRRPSLKNGFRYELLKHPFGISLSPNHLDMLARLKAFAQYHCTSQEILTFDRFLHKLIQHSTCQNPQVVLNSLFETSRSLDYTKHTQHIQTLEAAVSKSILLEIQYRSPYKGIETFQFLPEKLFYEQGALYVRGERPDYPDPSNLREDRILELLCLETPEQVNTLKNRRQQYTSVVLHIQANGPQQFSGFNLETHQGVYQETLTWQKEGRDTYCKVHLVIRESFYLQQRLLSCGLPFHILEPTTLKEALIQTLTKMRHLYTQEEHHEHSPTANA